MGAGLVWAVVGLVAGAVVNQVGPGRTAVGTVAALAAGVLGGLLGGWALAAQGVGDDWAWAGAAAGGVAAAAAARAGLRAWRARSGQG